MLMKHKQEPKILNTRYVLAVKDLSISVDYYKSLLGFDTWWEGEGWHFLKRGSFLVMLGECPDDRSAHETKNHSYFAYIDVENIDDLYDEFVSKEIKNLGIIEDKPWGQREFSLQTIDGHRMMFGQEILVNESISV